MHAPLPATDAGFEHLEREVWRAHSGGLAWPTLVLFAGLLAGTALVWSAALAGALPLWGGFIAMLVIGYAAFTPLHEAVHGNVGGALPARGVDAVVGWMSAAILFAPYPAFRFLHLRHHSVTNDPERDPDFWVASRSPLLVALRCLTILGHYYAIALAPDPEAAPGARRMRRLSIAGIVLLLGAAGALAARGLASEVLFLWALPGWLASGVLAFALDWVPHRPHQSRERYGNARIIVGPGLTVLMAGHNYHLIHHLYPRVPFYWYGRVFERLRPGLLARGAPVEDRGRGRSSFDCAR